MENQTILSIQNISKRFGGTQALSQVSMELKRGEIHALMGENGAGKSTLIKIISGVISKDSGTILMEDKPLHVKSPQEARKQGINVVYQELSLIPNLTVAENICASSDRMNTFRAMNLYDLGEDVVSMLESFQINPFTIVKNLGIGAQQMVEIAGAISRNCKLLILDEPTAALTSDEVQILYGIIKKLKEQGVTIIYISHKLSEIFDIADRVTVLKDGKYVGTVEVSQCDEAQLVSMMIGRKLEDMYPPHSSKVGDTVLEVKHLTGDGFTDVSFAVRSGEIVGFAGLAGAGRTEVCTAIFGANPIFSGEIYVDGQKVRIRRTQDAMKAGIGYLPEDRKDVGVFMQMNITDNAIASTIDKMTKGGLLDKKKVKRDTVGIMQKMNTKVGSLDDKILSLSGGNQQKVILARWLMAAPKVLIVDEPTRGIDVGAKYEIYQLLRQLADEGMAIVVISSELPEIFGLSDRVIAMYHGKISCEVNHDDLELVDSIGHAIMGLVHEKLA